MNYIFLDVDGVLNNKKHYKKQHKKYGGRFSCENMPFNPRSLRNLRKIVKKTKAKIVLTSSWRNSDDATKVLSARLMEYGLKIFSKTDRLNSIRGNEIKAWCEEQGLSCQDHFIIIDDDIYDMTYYFTKEHIVETDHLDGLTYFKTLEAIRKIKKLEKEIK